MQNKKNYLNLKHKLTRYTVIPLLWPFIYSAVLRIHDILVWIRICGSMPLSNRSGSGSCYFHHWPSRGQLKPNFKKVFCLFLFEGTFTSFFKDKKFKKSDKTVGIKVFLTFLLDDRRIRIRIILLTSGSGSGRPKNMWIRIRNTVFSVSDPYWLAPEFYLLTLHFSCISRLGVNSYYSLVSSNSLAHHAKIVICEKVLLKKIIMMQKILNKIFNFCSALDISCSTAIFVCFLFTSCRIVLPIVSLPSFQIHI